MKKGLLLAFGVTATLGLVAQTQHGAVAKKVNLNLEQTQRVDTESPSFYSSANASMRSGANPTVQAAGTMFSSSRNAYGLLVSQSNCLTANQTLGVAMFTHRLSADWAPANANSGFIQETWTTNNGTSWDSCYTSNDGTNLYRYPSGAILNPAGNTTVSNAWFAIAGPITDGSGWQGYYTGEGALTSGTGYAGTPNASNNVNSFPRIDLSSYSDSTVWVTGGVYLDDDGTTAAAQGYSGATLLKGTWNGTAMNWAIANTLSPSFHQDASGVNDCYTMAHLAFSPNGQIGYAVFFGVQASATTSATRAFQPIVYKTTDGGTTWSAAWAPYDYSSAFASAPIAIAATDGTVKPWFSMSNGSDIAVDNNGELHIVCAVEWGSSDNNDSLGFTWNRTDFVHYIWDVHTTGSNTWDAVLIDSLVCDATTTASPFTDGTAAFDLDARIQISSSPSHDHMFYFWADSDPTLAAGENAYPNLYGVGIDWSTGLRTAKKQFSNTDDFYWHYISNNALISGSTYTIPATNSIDRDGSHNTTTTFDHYYVNNVTFDESEFNLAIGINEAVASFGTVATYPNPANEAVNVNITLNKNENVTVSMFNALGQVVVTETRNMTAGFNTVKMNTSNLESGVYFMSVTAGTSTTTTKVVIE